MLGQKVILYKCVQTGSDAFSTGQIIQALWLFSWKFSFALPEQIRTYSSHAAEMLPIPLSAVRNPQPVKVHTRFGHSVFCLHLPHCVFLLLRVCVCPPACFWQPQKSTALSFGPAVPACHIRAYQHALTGVSEWRAPSKVGPQLKAKNKSSPRQSMGLSDSTYARCSQHSPPDTNGLWQRLRTRRHYLPPACTLTP